MSALLPSPAIRQDYGITLDGVDKKSEWPMNRRDAVLALAVACGQLASPARSAPIEDADDTLDFSPVAVNIDSVSVDLNAKEAHVPVRLSRAAPFAVHVRIISQNGNDPDMAKRALHGIHMKPVDSLLVFQPGETLKWVTIALLAPAAGRSFNVLVPDELQPLFTRRGSEGRVSWAPGASHPVTAPPPGSAFPAPQAGALLFKLDTERFRASATGRGEDGAAVWRTSLAGGSREQPVNHEPVIYTDPVLHPGTRAYGVEGGVLYLWAQKLATPLSINGHSYGLGASVLTTDGMFEALYGRFSAELRLPTCPHGWPGFWLYGHDNSEIDIMEVWRGSGYEAADSNVALHWPTGPRGGLTAKIRTANLLPPGIDLTKGFHEHAVEWRPDWTTWFIDGHEIYRSRTVCHKPLYVLLDMTLSQGATDVPPSGNALAVRKLEVHA